MHPRFCLSIDPVCVCATVPLAGAPLVGHRCLDSGRVQEQSNVTEHSESDAFSPPAHSPGPAASIRSALRAGGDGMLCPPDNLATTDCKGLATPSPLPAAHRRLSSRSVQHDLSFSREFQLIFDWIFAPDDWSPSRAPARRATLRRHL